jgi:hypothetical protein
LIREGFSAEEIVDIISKDDFLSETEIKHRMKASLDELKFRESKVDVKISDYIEKHYKDDVLFYLPNHPCDSVIKVYINRILTFLGYEPEDISEGDMPFRIGTLRGFDVPVYPAVEKTLGLDKCVRRYYPNKHLWNELYLDFREFMRLYISSIC